MPKSHPEDNKGQELRHRFNLGELLFDHMPMGIAIFDSQYRVQSYNPTWADFAKRYAPSSSAPLGPGVYYFNVFPGAEEITIPMYEKVLAGETIRGEGLRFETSDTVSYWDVVLAPLVDDGQVLGILNVTTDATERVLLQQNLEQRVEERTQELGRRREIAESFRDIIGMINDNLPLQTFLDRGVKLAAEQLEASASVLHQFDLEKQAIYVLSEYGMADLVSKGTVMPFSELGPRGGEAYLKATLQKQPTFTNYPPMPERVDEIKRNPNIPEPFKSSRIGLRQRFAGSFSVPLYTHGSVYGGMVFYYNEQQEFSEDQIQIGLTFAEQVGLAIENARLHQLDQDRQHELQTLLDVAATASSSLNLDDLLRNTLDHLVALVGASRAGVSLLDEEKGLLLKYIIRPERHVAPEEMARMTEAGQMVVDTREIFYVTPDTSNGFAEPGALLPLQVRGEVLGVLGIIGNKGTQFSPDQLRLFESIADQLSVAIENARLFEQAEETAITAERNRLARDLHDAVTQTLFSSSLIADVLPRIWERDPEEGFQRLEELRQLTRGALSEMRTLLVELRPAALADTKLKDLIRHQVNAFTARTRLQVETALKGEEPANAAVKEMVYRVVQEAFNNIAKHANASNVRLVLESQTNRVNLSIQDDGRGFELEEEGREGLGLEIMRERAGSIGASIDIDSQIGVGTNLSLLWPAQDQEEK